MLSICPTILTYSIRIKSKSISLTNVAHVSIAQPLWSDASTVNMWHNDQNPVLEDSACLYFNDKQLPTTYGLNSTITTCLQPLPDHNKYSEIKGMII